MQYDIKSIAKQFQIYGQLLDVKLFGSGHINDTYTALYDQGGAYIRYIIQRINQDIFKNPAHVMENIDRVTRHIRQKLLDAEAPNISRRVMTLIPACDGKMYYTNADENYLRA